MRGQLVIELRQAQIAVIINRGSYTETVILNYTMRNGNVVDPVILVTHWLAPAKETIVSRRLLMTSF